MGVWEEMENLNLGKIPNLRRIYIFRSKKLPTIDDAKENLRKE